MAGARRSRRGGGRRQARRPAGKRGAAGRAARRPARPGRRATPRRRATRPARPGAPRTGPWELVIDWKPARVPVVIRSVEARGAEPFTVAKGAWWLSPPPPLPLAAPDDRGRFAFSWSLQPDGGAAAMSLSVRRASGRKAAVASSRSIPSGKRWEGKGRTVAAP